MSVTAVMWLLVLLGTAFLAPRLRVSRLIPVVCLLLGFCLASLGLLPSAHDVTDRISEIISAIHVHF
ncbi:hypothetical protein [Frankia sp. CiP3]|uniref:hypothetical protein n=1 Tax=Frankia sp. CiP3 TaxID=2880971 RepID=UPI001EF41CDB|nr:hypothetical protein [Frankia sp. CiP3]